MHIFDIVLFYVGHLLDIFGYAVKWMIVHEYDWVPGFRDGKQNVYPVL